MTTADMIIDYLLNNYLVSFVMCLLGSLLKDISENLRNSKKLNIRKIFISTLFSSFLAASIMDFLITKLAFPFVIFCDLLIGVWGFWILQWVTSYPNFYAFISKMFKNFVPTEFIGDAMNETYKKNIDAHKNEQLKQLDKK